MHIAEAPEGGSGNAQPAMGQAPESLKDDCVRG
jgi:hypothetical protein